MGGNGNDTLIAGTAPDVLKGEAGDDVLNSRNGMADQLVDGGTGSNAIRGDSADPLVPHGQAVA